MARIATFSASLHRVPIWATVCILAISAPAFALNELFETYNAPQGLAMGNAFTADATDANSLFYNAAGLAKAENKGWKIVPIAIDGLLSAGFVSTAVATKTLWAYRIFNGLTAGNYNYFRTNGMASFTRRGFGVALLGSYEFAALSDGTNVDVNYHKDFGIVIGGATNLFANMIKIGLSAKAINRNEMLGSYALSSLPTTNTPAGLMKEGTGFGVDMGVLLTLPMSYLPTLGIAWKDMLIGTQFIPTMLLNPASIGTPAAIPQSFNVGASIRPVIWRGARATFSAELRHLERIDLGLTKKLHFGFQFVTDKKLYFWAGMNQMLPTGGVGLRLSGGDFELASYAEDIGTGTVVTPDRRFTIRYTISF